jgi:hypothetical protein
MADFPPLSLDILMLIFILQGTSSNEWCKLIKSTVVVFDANNTVGNAGRLMTD